MHPGLRRLIGRGLPLLLAAACGATEPADRTPVEGDPDEEMRGRDGGPGPGGGGTGGTGSGGGGAGGRPGPTPGPVRVDGGTVVPGTGGTGGSAGGGGGSAGSGGTPGRADGGTAPSPDAAPGAPRVHPSDHVFDPNVVRKYDITIAPADLAKMDADLQRKPTSSIMEVAVPATLTVDGEAVGKVSVRYKGATAGLRHCFEGFAVCKRYSYKLDFAEYEPEKRFHGLKKLNLHGLMRDKTYLHERLGYQLFREMGVLAPRSVHGKVTVNGEYKGVYAVTENIDGRFTDYAFPKGQGDGNLYKDGWPTNTQSYFYTQRQKTNEKAEPGKPVVQPTKIVSFATMLAAMQPKDAVPLVDKWLGVDHMLRMLATDVAITNWDGPRTIYCGAGQQCTGGHNFFVYESPTEDRLHYVAWDLDLTFEKVSPIEGMGGSNVPFWNTPIPANECGSRRWMATWGGQYWASGCDRLFQVLIAAGKDRWVAAVKKLLDGPFNVEKMRADIDKWAAQIDADVKTDTKGAASYTEWKTQVQNFKNDLMVLRQRMEAQAK